MNDRIGRIGHLLAFVRCLRGSTWRNRRNQAGWLHLEVPSLRMSVRSERFA
ncbi:hypothetical protein BIFPSEUDO_02772 [Bifidobacterium pseudocatenulatum DSM 20438 = JCM 1200 = LMG 10505]|uniref:Uncharacterized protein n=1 Tax=Bifidobacterium pseudocatenulatum DSM 20438 = JCM 1200 = LMG 10505 TaxID=547043 RepID=C0BQW7_BIFPS|nr:hypothetical protein BIFPSEUDO_02772 [Bifidobacterium pseudocatenulatum DSM 20438 = JCM 1200 = LMG 10505]